MSFGADTRLSAYYKALKQDHEPEMIHACYLDCGIDAKRFIKFALAVGVRVRLEIKEDGCYKNSNRDHLFSAGGSWTAYGINRDYFIPKLDELL